MTMMQSLEPRILRGYEILVNGDEPKQLDEFTFQVTSQSGNGARDEPNRIQTMVKVDK